MPQQKKHPPHQDILNYIEENGLRMTFIWKKLSLSQPYFHQIIYGIRPMPDRILNQINALFDTNFVQPEPEPEIFPHEQDAIDRESFKKNPLFKDQVDG